MPSTKKYTVKINLYSDRNDNEYSNPEYLIHQKELQKIIYHISSSLFRAEENRRHLDSNASVNRIHGTNIYIRRNSHE